MAISNRSSVVATKLMFLATTILVLSSNHVSAVNCDNDIVGLVTKCKDYVLKEGAMLKPSRNCCDVVLKANVPCLCSHVTKQIEDIVSLKKVFAVAKTCGKKVARGTKCGRALILKEQTVSAYCYDEKTQHQMALLASKCAEFIKKDGPKRLPSKECCDTIKNTATNDICSCINARVEAMVSMEKAVFIARKCGKNVPAGMKCGSYTIPPYPMT
ncbi:Bifunctional inhibitor/lipid-transfer protein/seed storage 2S albumin superfamily protein [Euphorbia peplus]|nr:Bifunctional inhibitor/lipid-transfer protein/seed storage 2S albumin superfamily protein [Euphorbia peplus]